MHRRERRKLERFAFKLPVAVRFESQPGVYQTNDLATRNVCAGGAYIEASAPLPVGTRTSLLIYLAIGHIDKNKQKNSQIKVDGAVIRTDPTGMAVSFDDRFQISPATL